MKLSAFAALPFAVLASSCFYGPYDQPPPSSSSRYGAPPPPYARPGFGESRPGPASPYYRPESESGAFHPLPPEGQGQERGGESSSSRPSRGPQLDPYGDPEPEPEPAPQPRQTHPTAERTDNPNRVLSPYPPYNVIDVKGFKSGALAKDPSNGKIFRVP